MLKDYENSSLLYFIEFTLVLATTYLCAFFIFVKTTKTKVHIKRSFVIVLLTLFVCLVAVCFGGYDSLLIKTIFICIICISLLLTSKKTKTFSSLPIAIISASSAFCLEYLSVVISGTFFYSFKYFRDDLLVSVVTSVIQFILCYLLLQIKPLSKCFIYIDNENNFGMGLLISSYFLLTSLLLTQHEKIESEIGLVIILVIPLILVGLILWIRSIVKRYYKNKLQDRMDEYTQKEMEDKDRRIERLEAEVTALAKQVHRDNHLMTSVDRSVQDLAACDSAEQREQIIGEIHTLYMERNDSIAKEQQKNKILPSTGFALIDSSLSELYVKAAARGISFDLTVSEEPYYLVNNIISQTDLQTLLCDHIKDAIIAVESAGITDGRILVTIEKKDSIFEIAIRDNGVDFEADTLARIGKEQVTTHADDGGSGIGFMTTFETLHKTKGSLIITEYEQKTPFSKSIAFVFDGLNRFVISTYRKEELENGIDRDDLLII